MLRTITVVGACFMMFLAGAYQAAAQENLEQLVAGAKKEGEVTLVASASTFGGKKGFADLEAGFNKRFGLKHKLNLAPGPSFPQVAARVLTELKSGAKSSTDLYLGSDGTMSDMHREKALQKVNWSGTFPWVIKDMEIFPQETLLVYASFHGIIYNSNSIPKDKAPKSYEDLVDPALSQTWAGKIAIPAYIHWLVRLSASWGKEKVLAYARKLAPLAGGRLRQGERSGSSAASFRSWGAPAAPWRRCGSGKPRERRWWDSPARLRRPLLTINSRCREIRRIPIPPNCSLPL